MTNQSNRNRRPSNPAGSIPPQSDGTPLIDVTVTGEDVPLEGEQPSDLIEARGNSFTARQARAEQRDARKRDLREAATKAFSLSREQEAAAGLETVRGNEYRDLGARALFDGLSSGLFIRDEVNAICGEAYGYVPKADGTPGKTPAGTGGHVRKRVFRCAEGVSFVEGKAKPKFFEGLSVETVLPGVTALQGGGSIWSFYDWAAKVKAEAAERVPAAFSEMAISKIVISLGEEGASARVRKDDGLMNAYTALQAMLRCINADQEREDAEMAALIAADIAEQANPA